MQCLSLLSWQLYVFCVVGDTTTISSPWETGQQKFLQSLKRVVNTHVARLLWRKKSLTAASLSLSLSLSLRMDNEQTYISFIWAYLSKRSKSECPSRSPVEVAQYLWISHAFKACGERLFYGISHWQSSYYFNSQGYCRWLAAQKFWERVVSNYFYHSCLNVSLHFFLESPSDLCIKNEHYRLLYYQDPSVAVVLSPVTSSHFYFLLLRE